MVGDQDYIKAVSSFKLNDAFPNMDSHPYDWRVDHYEPQRVWFTVRSTATHTGPLHFAGTTYKATGKVGSGVAATERHPVAPVSSPALQHPCWICCGGILPQNSQSFRAD